MSAGLPPDMKWIDPPSQGSNSSQSETMAPMVVQPEDGLSSMLSTANGPSISPRAITPTPITLPVQPSMEPSTAGRMRPPDGVRSMRRTLFSSPRTRHAKLTPPEGQGPDARTVT